MRQGPRSRSVPAAIAQKIAATKRAERWNVSYPGAASTNRWNSSLATQFTLCRFNSVPRQGQDKLPQRVRIDNRRLPTSATASAQSGCRRDGARSPAKRAASASRSRLCGQIATRTPYSEAPRRPGTQPANTRLHRLDIRTILHMLPICSLSCLMRQHHGPRSSDFAVPQRWYCRSGPPCVGAVGMRAIGRRNRRLKGMRQGYYNSGHFRC